MLFLHRCSSRLAVILSEDVLYLNIITSMSFFVFRENFLCFILNFLDDQYIFLENNGMAGRL